MRVEHIGDATLYLADCRDVLPTLGKVDAVVTDPPYGIDYDPAQYQNVGALFTDRIAGDNAPFDPAHLLTIASDVILWGANNFAEYLPRGGWLCWDKRTCESADRMLGSPFELAWINNPARYKMARIQHGGVVNADGVGIRRQHPTQKPIALMTWCLSLVPNAGVILDPYAGSGTTGVACAHEGRRFIGIEREPAYFDIACKRIADAYAQPRLFAPSPPAKPVQPTLFGAAA